MTEIVISTTRATVRRRIANRLLVEAEAEQARDPKHNRDLTIGMLAKLIDAAVAEAATLIDEEVARIEASLYPGHHQ